MESVASWLVSEAASVERVLQFLRDSFGNLTCRLAAGFALIVAGVAELADCLAPELVKKLQIGGGLLGVSKFLRLRAVPSYDALWSLRLAESDQGYRVVAKGSTPGKRPENN